MLRKGFYKNLANVRSKQCSKDLQTSADMMISVKLFMKV